LNVKTPVLLIHLNGMIDGIDFQFIRLTKFIQRG